MNAQALLKRIERQGAKPQRTADLIAARRAIEELKAAKQAH